jgi:hypothetical protein
VSGDSNKKKSSSLILTSLVLWAVLVSVGPLLVVLLHAALPLVIAIGAVIVAIKLAGREKW